MIKNLETPGKTGRVGRYAFIRKAWGQDRTICSLIYLGVIGLSKTQNKKSLATTNLTSVVTRFNYQPLFGKRAYAEPVRVSSQEGKPDVRERQKLRLCGNLKSVIIFIL